MSDINFNNFKVRCSAIHCILSNSRSNPCLTEKQAVRLSELEGKGKLTENMQEELKDLLIKKGNSGKVILSDTCITYLLDEYAWQTEKMVRVTKELMDVPQLQKGTCVEPDSLKLLSIVDGEEYKENRNESGERERVYNEFLSGEVDAYLGKSIIGAKKIPDVKSNWDYPTFLCKTQEKTTLANDWQVKGYLDISGAPEGFIANCLINTPEHIVAGQKYRLLSKMNVASEEATEFKEKWAILERSMFFDHIPHHKRLHKTNVVPMSPFEQTFLYDRVKVCREWLNNFHEWYCSINV